MLKQKIISTWYFEQDSDFGGYYPQNSGPAHTEIFRDTYRRCIYVFFLSARESNPDATLVLFLNTAWRTNSSKISREVETKLNQLGVEIIVIKYTFGISLTKSLWKNQFFVLDIIKYAYENWSSNSLFLILDSDIIWNPYIDSEDFWSELSQFGLLTYEIPYSASDEINGPTRVELTSISEEIEQSEIQLLPYFGGEFIAFDMANIEQIFQRINKDYMIHLSRVAVGLPTFTEEAHFLSHVFSKIDHPNHDASRFIKRIWTMFLKFRNSVESDKSLLLLHLPAEKNYGIRRLYKKSLKVKTFSEIFRFSTVGVPRNSILKIILDSFWAILRRAKRQTKFFY